MKHLKRICAGAYRCGNLHIVKYNSFWNVYEYINDTSCKLVYSTRNFKSARDFVGSYIKED